MSSIIKIDEISVKINNKKILDKLSLNIEQNTWISLVGPNGSGKSTLIKVLAGLISYDGYISISNLVLDKINEKEIIKRLGVVLDELDNNSVGLTALDDLVFPLENLNYNNDDIDKHIKEISKYFDISDLLNRNISELTNSDKQKLALSSSLITNPDILLLDDAFHQLEPITKKELLESLKKYKKDHKLTIIMVTHNLEDALITDKIAILNKGKIVSHLTPLQTLKDEKLLNRNGLKAPFIIDLSLRLMLYNLIDHVYLDERKLVDKLWK